MLAQGHMRVSEVARAFGMTHAAIDCIAKGKTWRHVDAAFPTKSSACEGGPVDQPKQESLGSITIAEDEL
jgi:hypothetical protein